MSSIIRRKGAYIPINKFRGFTHKFGKQYGNPKAGMWLDYILRQKEIEVGWFNERLKFVTTNSNGSRDYSLSSFLTPMKSEIVVNDETNKQGLINVTINITDDEKTIVTVKKRKNGGEIE